MWIIGLTGRIGAGKSTLAGYLREMGIPVHSADQEIHTLLDEDWEVQQKIKDIWLDAFINGKIDRNILGERATTSSGGLAKLEKILYPKLAKRQKEFLIKNQRANVPFVALDVPLLLEVGLDHYCHVVILAQATLRMRKERVLKRQGMTLKKFQAFENHQMKDAEKKKRVDFVISCGREKESALKRIQHILKVLAKKNIPEWNGYWPANLKRKPYDS